MTSEGTPLEEARRPADKPSGAREEPGTQQEQSKVPLLRAREAARFRETWREVQAGFVDDPRASVQAADALVAELMTTLTETFAAHRAELEGQWTQGTDAATEDLRVALRHYRSFFDRLLVT